MCPTQRAVVERFFDFRLHSNESVENKPIFVGEKFIDKLTKDFHIQRRFAVHKLKEEFSSEKTNKSSKESIIMTLIMTEDELLSFVNEIKIVIISGIAGSGKTTALQKITELSKAVPFKLDFRF